MENTKAKRRYTVGEEVANSVSHGVGALLSIAALVLLIVRAVSHGGGVRLAAALLMGIGLLVEYLFSTLYHAIAPEKAKRVFRVLDHCGIYLLIAGSYAPFALVALADRGGIALGIAVWAVAIVGIVAECFLREKQPKWLTALIYVILGWAVVFHIVDLWHQQVHPRPRSALHGPSATPSERSSTSIPQERPLPSFHLPPLAGGVTASLGPLFVL